MTKLTIEKDHSIWMIYKFVRIQTLLNYEIYLFTDLNIDYLHLILIKLRNEGLRFIGFSSCWLSTGTTVRQMAGHILFKINRIRRRNEWIRTPAIVRNKNTGA